MLENEPGGGNGKLTLAPEAVRDEGYKWYRLAGEMVETATAANGLSLMPTAFFFADLASVAGHAMAYAEFHEWLVELLRGAAVEFTEIGGVLVLGADTYVGTDAESGLDLTEIWGRRPGGD